MAYTIDGGYKPFTFQELVTPYMLYKDAYDKQEAKLEELYDKASVFSDLDDLPEDSQARKIYDNYMSSLNAANKDFATNGLTMNNRGLYSDIRRRYQGEIGKLSRAKTKLDEINKMRLTQSMQDPSMIYSQSNFGIDDLIGKNKPNTYGISGKYLYDLGSKAGATASSRVWSDVTVKNTANKYFLLASQTNGYTPEMLARMRDDFMAIPEFRKEVENAMKANGVTQNLTGDKYTQAALNYVNGFVDSCTLKRNDNLQQNPAIEFNEKVRQFNISKAMQEEQFNAQAQMKGFIQQADKSYKYDSTKDPELQKAIAVANIKAQAGGGSKGTKKKGYLEKPIVIKWDGRKTSTSEVPYISGTDDEGNTIKTKRYTGSHQSFNDLKVYWKRRGILHTMLNGIPQIVKDNPDDYEFYSSPYQDGDNPETLTIVPHKTGTAVTEIAQSTDASSEEESIASLH